MKLRLGWLADAEDADTYSARETRVLLPALARRGGIVPLWFAVGSNEPPHFWNGIRVFPVPPESLGSPDFLGLLIEQQRPRLILSNLPQSVFPSGFLHQPQNGVAWLQRLNPADAQPAAAIQSQGAPASGGPMVLVGNDGVEGRSTNALCVPYLRGLDPAVRDGEEPTAVLQRLEGVIAGAVGPGQWQRRPPRRPEALGGTPGAAIADEAATSPAAPARNEEDAPCLVMRQQLFCNSSLAQVMFELTNALIELGVPTVPQDEHSLFSKGYIHCEEEFWRAGAPAKFERIRRCLHREYDPESAITVHFTMLQRGARCTRLGVFPSLTPREVLYTTGNHTVTPDRLRPVTSAFEMVLAPSRHVLRPYFEAGLSPGRGAVVPHGIDPEVFSPDAPPLAYGTRKRFKFLQTSFPWVVEKGFDLTISAFCRAFSSRDDVALILRTPRIRDPNERNSSYGRLEALVKEAAAKPGAPEILLVEADVELNRRGGVYTGADCYVFPLRAEGFGMTILEAMGCGLPVIATPWSGPADFLSPRYTYTLRHSNPIGEHAKDGTILRHHVEPELDHLVHLMRHVYNRQDEAKAMGLRGAETARTRWTWNHAASKLASVFGFTVLGAFNPITPHEAAGEPHP